jgi:hypothetical protein
VAWPALLLSTLMLAHMAIMSYGALQDVRGYGRAASWLSEHPGQVFYASSYNGGMTPDEVKALPAKTRGYLVSYYWLDPRWEPTLAAVGPLRQWPCFAGSIWKIATEHIHLRWPRDHVIIYNLQDVLKVLKGPKP